MSSIHSVPRISAAKRVGSEERTDERGGGTPCYLCYGVVRVGSMRFDVHEPPRTSA